MPCAGDGTETCGGPNRVNIYWSGAVVVPPGNKPTVGTYDFQSCRTEPAAGRALGGITTASDTMTIEACATFCGGYTYFGTEYGRECT